MTTKLYKIAADLDQISKTYLNLYIIKCVLNDETSHNVFYLPKLADFQEQDRQFFIQ